MKSPLSLCLEVCPRTRCHIDKWRPLKLMVFVVSLNEFAEVIVSGVRVGLLHLYTHVNDGMLEESSCFQRVFWLCEPQFFMVRLYSLMCNAQFQTNHLTLRYTKSCLLYTDKLFLCRQSQLSIIVDWYTRKNAECADPLYLLCMFVTIPLSDLECARSRRPEHSRLKRGSHWLKDIIIILTITLKIGVAWMLACDGGGHSDNYIHDRHIAQVCMRV